MPLRTLLVLHSLITKIIFLWSTSDEAGTVPQSNYNGLALSRQQALKKFSEAIIPCNVKFTLVGRRHAPNLAAM